MEKPSQWLKGKIVIKKPPLKPVKGVGNQRVPVFSKKNTYQKNAARRWFFDKIEGFEVHSVYCNSGKQKKRFISPEAQKLWIKHELFWIQTYIQSVKDNKIKKNAFEKKLSEKSYLTDAKLKEKLKRIKSLLLENVDLGLDLIQNAEPWLFEALLDGAEIKKQNTSFKIIYGKTFGKGKGHYGRMQFWLTVALASKIGCCPKGINLRYITKKEFRPRNQKELEILCNIVLQCLTELQELRVNLWDTKALSDSAAEGLGQFKGKKLILNRLETLSDAAAASLGKFKGEELSLDGLKTLSDAAAASLGKFKGDSLSFWWLKNLSDAAAASLGKFKGDSLSFYFLKSLSDAAAKSLKKFKGWELNLSDAAAARL